MVGAYFYKSFLTLNNAFKKITIIFPLAMFVFYKVDIGYSMQEGPVCIMPGHTGLFHCLIPHCRENWEVAKKSVETIDGGNNFFFLSLFFLTCDVEGHRKCHAQTHYSSSRKMALLDHT